MPENNLWVAAAQATVDPEKQKGVSAAHLGIT